MSAIFRIYDPPECDSRGVALDFEKCRTCGGTGENRKVPQVGRYGPGPCQTCGGHGSLKAAALHELCCKPTPAGVALVRARCESCQHPMSEGAWTHRPIEIPAALKVDPTSPLPSEAEVYRRAMEQALRRAREGNEPASFGLWDAIHYSRCDEKCEHGGPYRWKLDGEAWRSGVMDRRLVGATIINRGDCVIEASWRPVDVRCMGQPCDLSLGKLKVLCLHCMAALVMRERGAMAL